LLDSLKYDGADCAEALSGINRAAIAATPNHLNMLLLLNMGIPCLMLCREDSTASRIRNDP
jgi:hypothetical protein